MCYKIHPFKVSSSVVFSIFTKLCSHHHNLIPEHFCHSPKKPPTHQQSLLIPVVPLQTNLFLSLWICLFWTLPINGTFSMWSFVSGFLAYFQGSNILQQISVLHCFVCVCVCVWPNNFLLYGCATFISSQVMDIGVLWTFMGRLLCGHVFISLGSGTTGSYG